MHQNTIFYGNYFIYCCIKTYHKFRTLKQCRYTTFHFHESGVQVQLSWVLCLGCTKQQPRSQESFTLILRPDYGESTSKITQILGRIHFFVAKEGVSDFLLAVSWRPAAAPRSFLQFLDMWAFPTWLRLKPKRKVSRVSLTARQFYIM